MTMTLALFNLVAGGALLYWGAEWLVRGGVRIATCLKVSALVIGLTLVAFATSAPELTVSCAAALRGEGDIAVGNVVGSNICNLALILGLSALVRPAAVQPRLLTSDVPVMLAATVALAALGLFTGGVTRWAGGAFFVALVVYLVVSVYCAKRGTSAPSEETLAAARGAECGVRGVVTALGLAAAGFCGLVGGAELFVRGAVQVGRWCGLSEAVIGLTIVAVGTSLPELATSLVAAVRGENGIAVGNVVGSNIFNVLCIMGIAPMISPLKAVGVFPADWGVLIGVSAAAAVFMWTGRRVSRLEGGILFVGFVLYTAYLILR